MLRRLLDWIWPQPETLPTADVARRVGSYMSAKIVADLYEFGQFLLNEGLSRTSQLESKATVVVGYSGAILAFLLARLPGAGARSLSNWAAIPALLALLVGFLTLRVHTYKWFSDSVWIPERLSHKNPEQQLHLHYFEAIYDINSEVKRANQLKGNLLHLAQWLLFLAVLTVAASLFIEAREAFAVWV